MPLFFFDTRDNDAFVEDDEGLDFPDLEAVRVRLREHSPISRAMSFTPASSGSLRLRFEMKAAQF